VTSDGGAASASANTASEESTVAKANDTAITVCFVKVISVVPTVRLSVSLQNGSRVFFRHKDKSEPLKDFRWVHNVSS
jgi:hypothetical protein